MVSIKSNSAPITTHEADIKLADAVKTGSAKDIRNAVADNKKAYESEYGAKDPEGYKKHIEWASQDHDLNKDSVNGKGWDLAKADVDNMFVLDRLGNPDISNPPALQAKLQAMSDGAQKDKAYDAGLPQNIASAAVAGAVSGKNAEGFKSVKSPLGNDENKKAADWMSNQASAANSGSSTMTTDKASLRPFGDMADILNKLKT